MGRYRYRQVFLTAAHYLFLVSVAKFRPLVIGGLFKLITLLAIACLLTFVVVHSENICRLVTACLRVLAISLFLLFIDPRWVGRSPTASIVPTELSLLPLFQRPPPVFSF
jgi:hypothetical protein